MKKFLATAIAVAIIALVAFAAGSQFGSKYTIETARPYWSQAEPCVIMVDFDGQVHAYNVE